MAVGSRDEDKGAGGPRTRYGVICLTHGNAKVALVRSNATETWQFPSVLLDRDAEPLEEQLEAALDVAQQQLGIDVTEHLCSQPVIHVSSAKASSCRRRRCCPLPPPPLETKAFPVPSTLSQALGPEPRVSTKFFMAFNVPEAPLAPATPMGAGAAQGAPAASWEDLQVGLCALRAWQDINHLLHYSAAGKCLTAGCLHAEGTVPALFGPPALRSRPLIPRSLSAALPKLGACLCSLRSPCWPLQGLLEETAQEAVAGNQLVAVLRQLQSMAKRWVRQGGRSCAAPPRPEARWPTKAPPSFLP